MAWFTSVPIIDVHRDNFESIWPSIVLALRNASFVALDAELSGLGPRKNLMLRSFDDRYEALSQICRSHSVLSLGLSCFKVIPSQYDAEGATKEKQVRYLVQTFNITTLCSEDYVVEPVALRFLVEHSFDFNKQYSQGVSYYRGVDKPDDKDPITPRALFTELLMSSAPIVLHNGLIDLAFLYQNLYSELPAKASQFICDMCEMFKGGVLDTKYVADFEARMVASYLEYVFRKSQRDNARNFDEDKPHIAVEFPTYPEGAVFVEYYNCALPENLVDGPPAKIKDVCEQYAAHGHCVKGKKCLRSHDADDILDEEEYKDVARRKKRNQKKRQRRRKRGHQDGDHNHGEPDPKVIRREDGVEDDENGDDEDMKNDVDDDEGHDGDDNHLKVHSGDVTKDTRTSENNDNVDSLTTESASIDGSYNKQTIVMESSTEQTVDECKSKVISGSRLQDDGKSDQIVDGSKDVLGNENENGLRDGNHVSHQDSKETNLAENSCLKPQYAGCHRAGYDAFMTGFAMATFVSEYGRPPPACDDTPSREGTPFVEAYGLQDIVNKLYLGGKDVPLQITKSHFAKASASHREKMKRIFKT